MIGDDVSITVLGVKGNQVRIGVNAPKNVSVHREEIYQRIQSEKNQQPSDDITFDDEDNVGNKISAQKGHDSDRPFGD